MIALLKGGHAFSIAQIGTCILLLLLQCPQEPKRHRHIYPQAWSSDFCLAALFFMDKNSQYCFPGKNINCCACWLFNLNLEPRTLSSSGQNPKYMINYVRFWEFHGLHIRDILFVFLQWTLLFCLFFLDYVAKYSTLDIHRSAYCLAMNILND